MKRLFIISAGAFGRELESYLEQSPDFNVKWRIAGYLHSGENTLSDYPSDYQVVGDWRDFPFGKDDMVIVGISDPKWKADIFNRLNGKVEIMTFVHPTALIGKFVSLGTGTIVCPRCILTNDVKTGVCVTINCGSILGHDARIGDFSSLMVHVDIGGWGSVGESTFMGTKSTLAPHKRIGDRCKISAGAVIMRSVKDDKIMFGNPAEEL